LIDLPFSVGSEYRAMDVSGRSFGQSIRAFSISAYSIQSREKYPLPVFEVIRQYKAEVSAWMPIS
jgi:hypothetical protein